MYRARNVYYFKIFPDKLRLQNGLPSIDHFLITVGRVEKNIFMNFCVVIITLGSLFTFALVHSDYNEAYSGRWIGMLDPPLLFLHHY